MNSGKYLFSQLVEFLPKRVFDGIVKKYSGDKYVKTFTCWNQLLVMMYGQLSSCDSLREVICIIDAIKNKSYHLGLVAIVEHNCELKRTTFNVLRVVSRVLTDKTPIRDLFNGPEKLPDVCDQPVQLEFAFKY